MQFISTDPKQLAVRHLVGEIKAALREGKKVVWLLSGGSAAEIAASVSTELPVSQKLLVLQVDERYGLPNHPDANWRHILECGFEASKFVCMPMLGNKDFETVVKKYNEMLQLTLTRSSYTVGLFGIGADGHTAGLLPGSDALHSEKYVAGFQGPDYQRITMTANAISKLDLAVAYAVGADKEQALNNLQKDLSISEQPAQALKLAKQAIIFNDYIGETS